MRRMQDVQQAARAARELGFEHHSVLFTFRQYLDAMAPAILAGESFTDGVQEYLLFREVGSRFRVALNGEGADELFGGYPEHWNAEEYLARLRNAAGSLPLTERATIERDRLLSTPVIDSDAWMLGHLVGSQLTDRHLQPLDKLSMASSVEVRVPYLDYDLAGYVQRLPTSLRINRTLGTLKYALRRVYLRRWKAGSGTADMLDAVLRQKFGFPDARRRSENRFHHLCRRLLPEAYFRDHPRRRFLAHSTQAMWFDLFQFLFCEHRGALPPDFNVLDFVAQRAGKATAAVASVLDEVAGGDRPPPGREGPARARETSGSRQAPDPRPAGVSENHADTTALVEKRLCDIVEGVGGREVGTNGRELWFRPATAPGIEIRLNAELDAPSYDRSANLAISYGGRSDDDAPGALLDVIASIKTIDETRLDDLAGTFSAAAGRTVRRFSNAARYRTGDEADIGSIDPADAASAAGDGEPFEPDPRWERLVTRQLNIVFCDFCAQLISGGQPLSPLHFGFWPADVRAPSAEADDFDPFWAFSENLLAYIPESAIRILDVGCGLGAHARLLSQRNKRVTAVSPVAHHCESIEQARLPGVEVRCTRFEEMAPDEPYDLLLFSESVNHFPLGDKFPRALQAVSGSVRLLAAGGRSHRRACPRDRAAARLPYPAHRRHQRQRCADRGLVEAPDARAHGISNGLDVDSRHARPAGRRPRTRAARHPGQ
jgi:SAM-dependent methyltransferase